ncbi:MULTISPECIES: Ppx/GppA phosphatase family protein [unclassified Methylotenera]|jgi:exopolyphosphatase/guanosine-5'-triphosphate,3'-diphosphate pyrophosphatase|uniref:Ppx/GppA phosphatase family protein n=1 Tax=unclassified Methylotenera TaxID=2643294 RepID=UPI000375E1D4|nr:MULTISPECIES: Ppx/GppA phosphatase family protein [unclassified Methylotenera]
MNATHPNASETLLAAVDLGSNSFRLEIGRIEHGQIQRVDYLKEAVRQGGDLDEDRNLTQDAIDRGLKCLARFGETLKGFPPHCVRAVATQTLREAKNRDVFIKQAKKALGYDVEVISGVEEARLIYQGVSRLLPQSNEKRLVIDIGGRSTEFIIGQHFNTETTDSLRVGSVAWSLKYFADGQFSERNFQRAEIAAESFLDMVAETYQHRHWDIAYGASGTVGAVADILSYAGFGEDVVTQEGLTWLRHQLIKAKHVSNLELGGLKEERKAVIAGGLSILIAVFDILKLDTLVVAKGALRHGLLYDMIAEDDATEDLRDASIHRLTTRFGANKTQAGNVSKVALRFFDLLSPSLNVPDEDAHEVIKHRQILGWAAYSHEIGCAISHSESQRHGAYILDNTELMGFAQSELHRLSLLVLGHYGKLRKLEADFEDEIFICQLLALRLAVIFCHSRNMPVLKNLQLAREHHGFFLSLPSAWQKAFPQTCYLLEEEVLAWQKTNWTLVVSTPD